MAAFRSLLLLAALYCSLLMAAREAPAEKCCFIDDWAFVSGRKCGLSECPSFLPLIAAFRTLPLEPRLRRELPVRHEPARVPHEALPLQHSVREEVSGLLLE